VFLGMATCRATNCVITHHASCEIYNKAVNQSNGAINQLLRTIVVLHQMA